LPKGTHVNNRWDAEMLCAWSVMSMTDRKIDRSLCLCPPCPSYTDYGELAVCLPGEKKSK